MFDFFRKRSTSEPAPAPVPMHKVGRLSAPADPPSEPGKRVHSEYFASETPGPNGYEWTARVYAPGGVVKVKTGTAGSRRKAAEDAIEWATATKTAIRSKQ